MKVIAAKSAGYINNFKKGDFLQRLKPPINEDKSYLLGGRYCIKFIEYNENTNTLEYYQVDMINNRHIKADLIFDKLNNWDKYWIKIKYNNNEDINNWWSRLYRKCFGE